ncbi:acyl-CoA dehydrogenase, partial [Methylobacterium sp. WL19]
MILSPPLRDTAEGLARLFAERAEGHDRAGRFAHDNIADLRNAGLPGLIVPRRLGGGGAVVP